MIFYGIILLLSRCTPPTEGVGTTKINRGCGAELSSGAQEPGHSRTLELIRNSYLSPMLPRLTSNFIYRELPTGR